MTNRLLIPQNIVDLVDKLCYDKNIPQFQRDLACATLERVVAAATPAIASYHKELEKSRKVR